MILKEQAKKRIQDEFKSELGLLIDVVKQGAGTTNDGNTARRFFSNPEITARVTGIDVNVIQRFHVILQVIASGEHVNITKYSDYCETAVLCTSEELYGWYYMPLSVHKLLIHGADIFKHFGMLPIGKLSEEASEARNKDFRNVREHHARKCSRTMMNEDILHNFLISSDPQITLLRPRLTKKATKLSPEALELLIIENNTSDDDECYLFEMLENTNE